MKLNWEKFQNILGRKKAKYLLIVAFCLSMILLLIPQKQKNTETENIKEPIFSVSKEELRIEEILNTIQGAGNVKVYLSINATEEKIYGQNMKEKWSDGQKEESNSEYSFLEDGNSDQPLLLQTVYPVFRGAVISAEGAEEPTVCLQLLNAVKAATGLSGDKIQIVIMKNQGE